MLGNPIEELTSSRIEFSKLTSLFVRFKFFFGVEMKGSSGVHYFYVETECWCNELHTIYIPNLEPPMLGDIVEFKCPVNKEVHKVQTMGMSASDTLSRTWIAGKLNGNLS